MEEPTSGRVTTAQMMVYVGEEFEKLCRKMDDGFERIEQNMREHRQEFVARREFEAVRDAHKQRMDSQADDVKRIVWWLMGIGGTVAVAIVALLLERL